MERRAIPASLALALVLSALSPSAPANAAPVARPAAWATAVSRTSVGNLYRVEPDLFRSAQPSSAGFRELEALGIKSVLDVAGGDGDKEAARGTGLKLLHVPMTAWGLRDGPVLEALRILGDAGNRPLIIHCQHGADRTGAIVALYRVVVQGWTKEDAVREMNEGGFHHSSFWKNLDRYVLDTDVEVLRRKLGIVVPAAPSPSQALVAGASTVSNAAAAPVAANE